MFLKYQIEIIAVVFILLLLIVYIIINQRNTQTDKEEKKEEFDKTQEEQSNQEPEAQRAQTSQNIQKEAEIQEEIINDLDGSEEGDFGVEELPKEQKEEESAQVTIQTREVPPHGKISKQNFEEFSGIRLLVAEDNLINQKVISGLLADSGIEIVLANDGQEALDILAEDDNFLMVLMDAHMPVVDGFEATRLIRANPQYNHIVVIALSGDTAADDVKKMSEAGMANHLEKPLRMESLYDVLYAYTGSQEESQQSEQNYIEVPMTKELNGDEGLTICGGDEEFYFEILHEFINTYANSAQKLQQLLANSQEVAADKLLLDIIGVTANIGAHPLHKTAIVFKDSLKDREEKSYLTILDEYQHHLDLLVKDIKEFINR